MQENLGNNSDVMFGSDYSSLSVDPSDHIGYSSLFIIVQECWFLLGFDLCVLASSDHNIISYGNRLIDWLSCYVFLGTFGLWGSLLAGGDVIAAKGTSNVNLSEEDEIYLRSGMPGWLYVDTRDKNNITVLQVNTTTQTFTPAIF